MSPRLLLALVATALSGQVTGVVVDDQSGDNVASAQVSVWRRYVPASRILHTETDRFGRFRLDKLAADDYQFVVDSDTYTSVVIHHSVRIGAEAEPWTIRLSKRGAVSGIVTDNEARPIGGAKVYPLHRIGDLLALSSPGSVTDTNGYYRLFGLSPGKYSIAAVAVPSRGGLQLPPPTSSPVLSLGPGSSANNVNIAAMASQTFSISGRIAGRADDETFVVSLVSSDNPGLSLGSIVTRGGEFTFQHVPSGNYELLASGPVIGRTSDHAILRSNPRFGRVSIVVVGQNVVDVLLEVRRSVPRSFELRSRPGSTCSAPTGVLLSPIEAWAARMTRNVTIHPQAPTVVSDLAPGRYSIVLDHAASFCNLASPLIIDSRTVLDSSAIPLQLSEGSRLSGTVTKKSPDAAVIILFPTDGANRPMRLGFSNSDGSFSLPSVLPDEYLLGARSAGDLAPWLAKTSSFTVMNIKVGDDVYAEITAIENKER